MSISQRLRRLASSRSERAHSTAAPGAAAVTAASGLGRVHDPHTRHRAGRRRSPRRRHPGRAGRVRRRRAAGGPSRRPAARPRSPPASTRSAASRSMPPAPSTSSTTAAIFPAPLTGDTVFAIPDALTRTTALPAVGAEVVPAGTIPFAQDVALDGADLIVSDGVGPGAGRVVRVSGGVATNLITSGLDYTAGVTVDGTRLLVGNVDASFVGSVVGVHARRGAGGPGRLRALGQLLARDRQRRQRPGHRRLHRRLRQQHGDRGGARRRHHRARARLLLLERAVPRRRAR